MSTTTLRPAAPTKCGTCNRPLESPLYCSGCRTLYAAGDATFFELMGLPPQFDLDAADLRARYLKLSRETHPDRFADRPDSLPLSLQLSAALNRAFQVLGDPLTRAEYLLELSGGPSAQQDKAVAPEMLTMTLLMREELDEAHAASDSAAIDALRSRVQRKFAEVQSQITDLARRLAGETSVRRELRAKLNTVRYFQRLLEQMQRP